MKQFQLFFEKKTEKLQKNETMMINTPIAKRIPIQHLHQKTLGLEKSSVSQTKQKEIRIG